MIEFEGKLIPANLDELVDPEHTAVVVVDAQNDFFGNDSASAKLARNLSKGYEVVKRIQALLEQARKAGVKVVYLQHTNLPNHAASSAVQVWAGMRRYKIMNPALIPVFTLEGSKGQEIVEEIKPTGSDVVVKKSRQSGFVGTNLDMLLRSHRVTTIVVTGVVTQGCVLGTASDARYYDYFVVIPRDCVDSPIADLHEAALKILEIECEMVNSEQLISTWKKKVAQH